MVNSNTKKAPPVSAVGVSPTGSSGGVSPAGNSGTSTGGSLAGASSNPGGNTGSGGTAANATPPGVIPGAAAKGRHNLRTEITQIANGFGTQFPDLSATIPVKGQSVSAASLLTALVAVLGLFKDVDGTAQTLKQKRLALKAATPGARDLVATIKVALVGLFGKGNPVLENFGFNVSPKRKLTSEQLTARKAKLLATRALRGTKGPRAKSLVKFHGTVQVQTSLSGNPAAGGNASPTGTSPSSAGTPTGAPPSGGNTGSGPSQP